MGLSLYIKRDKVSVTYVRP